MSEQQLEQLEQQVIGAAAAFRYPATPEFKRIRPLARPAWRWAWGLAAVVVLAALVSVPPVRAALVDWLQIGSVSIEAPVDEGRAVTVGPSSPDYQLDRLSGLTTLEAAREAVEFPISLPADWGQPDRVFLQTMERDRHFAILVWGDAQAIDLVLYVIGPDVSLAKGPPQVLTEVEVNGRPGAYVEGEHLLVVQGFHQFGVLVQGPALIWEGAEGLTYRLEGAQSLEALVEIAESIR